MKSETQPINQYQPIKIAELKAVARMAKKCSASSIFSHQNCIICKYSI